MKKDPSGYWKSLGLKGGAGSGNFGHSGRPGERGGSGEGGGGEESPKEIGKTKPEGVQALKTFIGSDFEVDSHTFSNGYHHITAYNYQSADEVGKSLESVGFSRVYSNTMGTSARYKLGNTHEVSVREGVSGPRNRAGQTRITAEIKGPEPTGRTPMNKV